MASSRPNSPSTPTSWRRRAIQSALPAKAGDREIGSAAASREIPPGRSSAADPPTTGINRNDYAANLADFLAQRQRAKPFCFWYECFEPHRPYEPGTGIASGKSLADVTAPPYLPDDDVTRSDLLDYAREREQLEPSEGASAERRRSDLLDYDREIEWFDTHLARMLKMLEDAGELDNTWSW